MWKWSLHIFFKACLEWREMFSVQTGITNGEVPANNEFSATVSFWIKIQVENLWWTAVRAFKKNWIKFGELPCVCTTIRFTFFIPQGVLGMYFKDALKPFDFRCTAYLISHNFLLTAAHCVDKDDKKPLFVRFTVCTCFSNFEIFSS